MASKIIQELQNKLDDIQTMLREESITKTEMKCQLDNQVMEHENQITKLKMEHQLELKTLQSDKLDEFKQRIANEDLIYLQEKFDKLTEEYRESSVSAVESKSKLELKIVEQEKQIENMIHGEDNEKTSTSETIVPPTQDRNDASATKVMAPLSKTMTDDMTSTCETSS